MRVSIFIKRLCLIGTILSVTMTVFFSGVSQAAELLKNDVDYLVLKGEIVPGDYEKLINGYRRLGRISEYLILDSPGGDVETAMQIGRFLRKAAIAIEVRKGTICNSSCVLILIGAPERVVQSPIGVHRPYYERSTFAKLSLEEANEWYRQMDEKVCQYMAEMNVPESFVERMMATSSSDIEYIGLSEFGKTLNAIAPAYSEWLDAKCGTYSESEGDDIHAVNQYDDFEFAKRRIEQDKLDEDMKGYYLQKLANNSKGWGRASDFSKGYRDYLLKKQRDQFDCWASTLEQHHEKAFSELIQD